MQSGLAEFVIDETFGVPGVGTVVAGTVKQGIIRPNTTLLLGECALVWWGAHGEWCANKFCHFLCVS